MHLVNLLNPNQSNWKLAFPPMVSAASYLDGFHHFDELDFGGESVAVEDDRHALRPVPAVKLNGAAAHSKAPSVRLDRTFTRNLKRK